MKSTFLELVLLLSVAFFITTAQHADIDNGWKAILLFYAIHFLEEKVSWK